MKAASALERMNNVASKFDSASDLMQSAANDAKEDKVEVKEKETTAGKAGKKAAAPTATPKKEKSDVHTMASRSRPEAKAVKNYNEHNQTTINKHLPANDDGQTERQNKQIALAQQQAISMKQLNSTMKEILTVLEAEKNKITPKTQEFAKSKGFADVIGQAKNGMIDKIGSLLGDLMGDFKDKLGDLGDMLGGGKDKKGKRKKKGRSRSRDRARAKRREAARIRAGGAPGAGPNAGGGWWSGAGERLKGMFKGGGGAHGGGGAPRIGGGGRVGTALKIGAGIATAVGGYEGVKWLGGKLGMVSKSEESGKGGVGTVSSGKGDNGGVSYGSHQLSSASGTMTKFLQSKDGQPYAQQLAGLQPGSAAFTQKYKEIASSDGENFEKAQDQYLNRTHYDPQVKKVTQDTGMDFSKKGRAVQEMLYSTGIQYGPDSGVVSAALKGKPVANMSDSEIVQTVQDYKSATTDRYFTSSSAKVQASVANRALREKAKLLAMDKQELEAKASGAKPEKTPPSGVSMAEAANEDNVEESTVASAAPVQNTPSAPAEPVGILPMAAGAGVGAAALLPALMPGRAKPPTVPSLTPAPVATPSVTPVAEPRAGALGAAERGAAARGGEQAVAAGAKGMLGRGAAKILPGANVAFGALDAYDVITDEETTRQEKEKSLAGIGGGFAGAAAGASAGTAAGTAIGAGVGSLFFGVGAIPGAAIGAGLGLAGGAVGGYFGYNAGQAAGEGLYDAALGSPEEQAAKQEADAAKPVAGSTPLMMLTQQKADETGDTQSVSAAAAMKTVDEAIKKSTAAIAVVTKDKDKEKEEAAKAAAPETPAATPEVKASGAVASSSPQTPGDVNTMLAGAAATGVAAGLASAPSSAPATAGGLGAGIAGALAAGLGLPPGWAESITSGYGDALAAQAQAMGSDAVLPTPGAPASASAPVTAPTPTPTVSMPAMQKAPPVVTAPQPTQAAAPTSPASSAFYKDSDIAPSASSLAAANPPSSVNRSSSAPTTVTSTATTPEPVERQQYEPVKSVMMIEPKQQDTLMPQRMQPGGDKISSKGVSEGNSVRQTLDDAPAVITDQGLVMLQVGFI